MGELVVKGADGHFYSVSVDSDGNITSTLKQVRNDDVADVSINAGEKLIEGTVTTATLNVRDIFADSAIVRSLIAANLDVDALFAREATVQALNAVDITGNTYLRLLVDSKADQSSVDALAERVSSAELRLTDDSIVSIVTSSQVYREQQAQIHSEIEEAIGYRLEIISDTVFLTETVRNTTLRAQVWRGTEDVTDSIEARRFSWKRTSNDAMADQIWNANHTGMKSVTISATEVLKQASFRCELADTAILPVP